MASRLLLALLATAALAFSGCSGKDAGAGSADPIPAAPAPSTGDMAQAAAAPQTVVATRAAEETPVHVEGTTYTGACAYAMGEGTCEWENGDHAFGELGKDGQPARFAGTLAWTAATPATQELSLYVLHQRDDGYYWFDDSSPMASGPSPLAFDFDLSRYADTHVAFSISSASGEGLVVAYAAAGASQGFTLDGTFTSIVLRA